MMKTLAVTGGIGSGKSAVTAYLAAKGCPGFDCDAAAKSLYDRRPEIVDKLEAALGIPLRDSAGALDRRRLASAVFSDPSALQRVESVVHPAVLSAFLAWRETFDDVPFVVIESAILLSKPLFDGVYDRVLLVDAPEEIRVARAMRRDSAPESVIRARVAAQSFDLSKVDVIVPNDGTLETLYRRIDRVFPYLFPE